MAYLYGNGCSYSVAVAVSNGRMFICSTGGEGAPLMGDMSFVITELAAQEQSDVHCLAVTSDGGEMWCVFGGG